MSGGGGGGGGGGFGGLSPSQIECSRLIIRTTLNSPNPDVLEDLQIDDELEVELIDQSGPVLVKNHEGERVGSITDVQLLDLIRCLSEGYEYIAIVKEISGGLVKIQIRPKSA